MNNNISKNNNSSNVKEENIRSNSDSDGTNKTKRCFEE
jgi:hypothetical protein